MAPTAVRSCSLRSRSRTSAEDAAVMQTPVSSYPCSLKHVCAGGPHCRWQGACIPSCRWTAAQWRLVNVHSFHVLQLPLSPSSSRLPRGSRKLSSAAAASLGGCSCHPASKQPLLAPGSPGSTICATVPDARYAYAHILEDRNIPQ